MERQSLQATAEYNRLITDGDPWRHWGPYLSERAWGTVREDYSPDGRAWDYFSHDMARSRAYRWNEDGLGGISDDKGRMCFALALWNGYDPILKERLFGLTGTQGNHGEDVKECYFYLDSTPTHSYMRMLYKYPHAAFPYRQLVEENARRGRHDPEFELLDTGIFNDNNYFDIFIEYAKAAPEDILIRIRAINRGNQPALLHLLPTLWFRNTWSWGAESDRPLLKQGSSNPVAKLNHSHSLMIIEAEHSMLGSYMLSCEDADDLLFTNNDTNHERLFSVPNSTPYVKDAFHEYLIHGRQEAVNPARTGTKAAALYTRTIAARATVTLCLRLTRVQDGQFVAVSSPFADFDQVFDRRQQEADEYYAALQPAGLDEDQRRVQRQTLAGMLWSKQFYHYIVDLWLKGDPAQPAPPYQRRYGRNAEWRHLYNERVMSMPDKWEYPWYAAWDLAFHCVPLAHLDPEFAKSQLVLLGREWYMHPNGQLPAYEWSFSDVNPPVQAWAAMRVFEIDGGRDFDFLERVLHKLILNFNWWVNRKDSQGSNVFEGGFLGMDNIGPIDRSAGLPAGGRLEQSDGTAWMAVYCLSLLEMSLTLAAHDPTYEDLATKFFEHFTYIASAMDAQGLWDEQDSFYYDVLHLPDGSVVPLKVRSLVGVVPLCAVTVLDRQVLDRLPGFAGRLRWFLENKPQFARVVSHLGDAEEDQDLLLSVLSPTRLAVVLRTVLSEAEFLSPFGLRSLSAFHGAHPFRLAVAGLHGQVDYEPAESRSGLFGGNSNWRGPVWFPLNYLALEALHRFHRYLGEGFTVEHPTGSGNHLTLEQVSADLAERLVSIFLDEGGRRPVFGDRQLLQSDPRWHDLIPFHEYFHGDNGSGLGASHQTGWTGLVADLLTRGRAGGGTMGS